MNKAENLLRSYAEKVSYGMAFVAQIFIIILSIPFIVLFIPFYIIGLVIKKLK